jgi:hypothetical protein
LRLTQVFQPEGHVVKHRHVRVQRVRLEHHGAAPVRRRHLVHHLSVDADVATRGQLQPRNHPQQGGFAAARGPDKHHKLAVVNRQADAVKDGGLVKAFDHVV